ncbi:FAD-dependent oxidoreductase [Millisia brevis]|uniref:FAD-dependent oxidoreductase n=1 Tax=Millisia brevis TaxID=264148 RepID=UPI0008316679|nr:FAD-dependent oxidoreductase [Millisia brevis]
MTSPTEPAAPVCAPASVDLVVVGAGPAGMAGAVAAAEAGLHVAVVDAAGQPGGQYWRHADERTGDPEHRPHGWSTYLALRARFDAVRASGRLSYLPGRQVWFIDRADKPAAGGTAGFAVHTTASVAGSGPLSPDTEGAETRVLRAGALLLCPGGYDRQLPIPGWDLPGVMAAGGVQAMVKGSGTVPGRRAVVAGTGPFLLPVATGLAEYGVKVAGIFEAGALRSWVREVGNAARVPAKAGEAVGYVAKLARHRIPYRTRRVITAIHGDDRVAGVTVAAVDGDGRVRPGTERQIACDLVALGWGFTPSPELVIAAGADTRVDVDGSLVAVVDDAGRTSAAGVYAAGEITGVGGATVAVDEGELAGLSAAADAGLRVDTTRCARLRSSIARGRAFAGAMHRSHPVPPRWSEWLTDDTVICRCEEVTHADIRYAREHLGAHDPRTVKMLARPGMGWCQGRVCGFATTHLSGAPDGAAAEPHLRATAKRPLAAPITLDELAALDDPNR